MPELEPQQPPADPIAALHKMSTTAGISTGEYVAINNLAISAAVLGLATALVFVGLPFLLLGLAAIGLGVVALRQIHDSNGTQGGRGLAILGILLALLLSGSAIARQMAGEAALRPEKQAINTT